MLDVVLRNVSFRYRDGFGLREISATFQRGTHTALAGPPGSGASTLLRLIAGTLRPDSGDVIIGQRQVNALKPSRRPLLHSGPGLDAPARWSVRHVLVAAVRARSLDRIDRHREFTLAAEKWELAGLLDRRTDSLSASEQTRAECARIELLRPGILLADRLLEQVNASLRWRLTDDFYRMLRVHGTTVITAPASREELGFVDSVIVLDDGRIVERAPVAALFAGADSEAAGRASGECDLIPVTIRGATVSSVIGEWQVDPAPFQGSGVALVRPQHFVPALRGEDSDLIFGIEEAGFVDGRWIARGLLSGGVSLRVSLPADAEVHKGRLIALRYDPRQFRLLQRELAPLGQASVPTDVVPLMRDSR